MFSRFRGNLPKYRLFSCMYAPSVCVSSRRINGPEETNNWLTIGFDAEGSFDNLLAGNEETCERVYRKLVRSGQCDSESFLVDSIGFLNFFHYGVKQR